MAAGQPTKYTDEIADVICKAVASGMPVSHAAVSIGVTKTTLYNWQRKNKQFFAAIKRARAECMQARLADVLAAAKGGAEVELQKITTKHKDGSVTEKIIRKKTPPTWTAAAWYLERQFCEEFGLNRLDLKELLNLLRASKQQQGAKNGRRV